MTLFNIRVSKCFKFTLQINRFIAIRPYPRIDVDKLRGTTQGKRTLEHPTNSRNEVFGRVITFHEGRAVGFSILFD